MKKKILYTFLLAALILTFTACSSEKTETANLGGDTLEDTSEEFPAANPEEPMVLGEGEKSFLFEVTDEEGQTIVHEIHTDATSVGEALLDLGLIEGEDGDYGLYVKTVNGLTLDYDADGKYWAFYVDGEYAPTSVENTEIVEGTTYSFLVE